MATLELTSLTCVRKQDVTGSDEPRILVNGDVVWNGSMQKDETENLVPTNIPFADVADVKLQEMNGNNAKQIGGSVIIQDDPVSARKAIFKTSGAHYELWYKVT